MSYTATKLITNSYYLSGIVSRDFQTVSGSQLNDGLDLLNAFLAVKTANTALIPYYKEFDLSCVVGQEQYFVANLVGIETITFTLGTVRYPMERVNRRNYFGDARANNVNSLPFNWHEERTQGGMNFYLYFFPSDTFPLQIWGKFGLSNVTLNEDLETVYDDFYIEYLRHGLAKYICDDNNITFQQGGAQRLEQLEKMLRRISPPDLTLRKVSIIGSGEGGLTWADVNIGHGYRPI